ncbi:hypothetical protein [Nocardia sp. NPDC004260]
MGGDVTARQLVPIAIISLVLSGCSLLSHSDHDKSSAVESNHTLQELCDFPKNFFSTRYGTSNLEITVDATRPMSTKIGGGNGCSYQTPGRKEYLGNVSLFYMNSGTSSSIPKQPPSHVLQVGGVAVTEVVEPIPDYLDPTTARPYYKLTASIDGWEGQIEFKNGDDEGALLGAQVLVDMIHTLKR